MYNSYPDNYANQYVGYNPFPFGNELYQYSDDRKYGHQSKTKISIIDLNNALRQLWEEHITWTKLTIMSIASDAPDTQLVTNRLLRNAPDFGQLFSSFYNQQIAQEFSRLLRDHLTIAADLVVAAKKQDSNAVSNIERKWYANADEIANFLNYINPSWNNNEQRKMLYDHLALTKAEAVAILTSKYSDSIDLFDRIEQQALMMADSYTKGLIKQFPNKITDVNMPE